MFAPWHLVTLLHAAGWPRRTGLFRRETVDSLVADTLARVGLFHSGMAIGAFDVPLSCSLVAEIFSERTEWRHDFDELLRTQYSKGPDPLVNYGKSVPASLVGSNTYQAMLSFDFVSAVWEGVRNPDEVTSMLSHTAGSYLTSAREAIAAGMDMDAARLPSSAEEFYDLAREYVRAYEEVRGVLPSPPAGLIELAHSVRTPR